MCAVFGLIDYNHNLTTKQKEKILKILSKECEIRGTDATGYAFNNGSHITIFKRSLPARKMKLKLPDEANVIMGHTRMATQGSNKRNYNNHPFMGRIGTDQFALAHNGVISNDLLLHKSGELPPTIIETDSYAAVQLIEKEKHLGFDSIRTMAETLKGSFVFTILDSQDNMYFVQGNNPLCIVDFYEYGFYLYASTKDIVNNTIKKAGLVRLSKSEIQTTYGDILKIENNGEITKTEFDAFDDYYCFSGYAPMSYQLRQLKEFANCFGIDESYVDLLADNGYTADEIEELLYEPEELLTVTDTLMYEGLYC